MQAIKEKRSYAPHLTQDMTLSLDKPQNNFSAFEHPLAITMWDFSWIERRWPGAGYENWDLALDELAERGYDAIRLDAFPHFHAADPHQDWEILPCWNQQDWGSPARNRIRLQPSLNEFLAKCSDRNIRVALSTWYQNDATSQREKIETPEHQAEQWLGVIEDINRSGLAHTLLWLDLCNEWPFSVWAPFFNRSDHDEDRYVAERSRDWMRRATTLLRQHTNLPLTFSLVGLPRDSDHHLVTEDWDFLDFWETHIWMVQGNHDEFYKTIGYDFPRWDSSGYEKVVSQAESLYRSKPDHWLNLLKGLIDDAAAFSKITGKPLATTECWGIVDYKDWPLLDWGWVKECCEVGTLHAAATGRWFAIATSNFCGPQFKGMWRDVAWHQRITAAIKSSVVPH